MNFWQAPDNGVIVNLDHVVGVDRPSDGDLRVVTVVPTMTVTLSKGSTAERSFLDAIARCIGEGSKASESTRASAGSEGA